MKYLTAVSVAVALAVVCSVPALAKEDSKAFMRKAISGDVAEVKMGELAQSKSQNSQVQNFGQTLVQDHGANEAKAKSVAQQVGVTPPSKSPKQAQQEYDKLSKMNGSSFDREFVNYAVKDHQKDVKAFSNEAKQADNKQVAQFAEETLPTLQKHLQMAENLQKSMK